MLSSRVDARRLCSYKLGFSIKSDDRFAEFNLNAKKKSLTKTVRVFGRLEESLYHLSLYEISIELI